MSAPLTEFTISSSQDSTLAVEVTMAGLLGRKKKRMFFFESFTGAMRLVDENPAAAHIELTIDAASVACRDAKLSEKERLAAARFVRENALGAARYPAIRYTSTHVRAKPLRGFVVTGLVEVREVKRELNINLAWTPRRKDDFQLDGDTSLRLSDFGLPRPSSMFGLISTKDDVLVHLLLWAVPLRKRPS
jgi:polyisoprenoid-binding protein YceI